MLFIGCMNADQAIGAIDWTVYITIAFAFGVSSGREQRGWGIRKVHGTAVYADRTIA